MNFWRLDFEFISFFIDLFYFIRFKFINSNLKETLTKNIFTKISLIFSYFSLKKFKNKLDPRKYNGAIFLGLDSPVVKSHGGTDFIGFSNSLDVCHRIVKGNLIKKIKQNI